MRIRTIKPEFWKSESMCGLSAGTRLLAIGLLNYADDEGFFLAHPALIRGELMPFDAGTESIPGMLQELVGIGYLELIVRENRTIGRVVNFRKHQLVNRPQKSKLAVLVNAHGAITDDSVNAHGAITDDSVNAHGAITAGMDQGSGNGSGNGKGMEGSGEASQGKPGGSAADSVTATLTEDGLSSSKPAEEDSSLSDAARTPAPAKKKEGGGAVGTGRAKARTTYPEPEWPLDLPSDYREPLRSWWEYKRERREGYKPKGWEALVRQQQRFPVAQVRASVEASMANNWAGLFTEKAPSPADVGYGFGRQKKEKGGGAAAPRQVQGVMEPTWDWREVAAGLGIGCALWAGLERGDKLRILRAKTQPEDGRKETPKGTRPDTGGFECPVPCDWRVAWAEIYAGQPSPETWEGVSDLARRQIVVWIEERKRAAGTR